MSYPDPNVPDTPPSEPSEEQPSFLPVSHESDDPQDETPFDDSPDSEAASFEQADIAEPFEADIPEAPPVPDDPQAPARESRVSMELFQQGDIAEPFEAAIPHEILDEPETDLPAPTTAHHDSLTHNSTVISNDEPLLFDDDYSPQPNEIVVDDTHGSEPAAFQADEFGEQVPLTVIDDVTEPPQPQRLFDDLTLSEVAWLMLRQPVATTRALIQILTDSPLDETPSAKKKAVLAPEGAFTSPDIPVSLISERRRASLIQANVSGWDFLTLGLYILAYAVALAGCFIFLGDSFSRREENIQLVGGFQPLVASVFIWLLAELIQHQKGITAWGRSRTPLNWLLMALRLIPLAVFVWVGLRWTDVSDEPIDPAQTQQILDMIAPTFPLLLIGVLAWIGVDLLGWALRFMPDLSPHLRPRLFSVLTDTSTASDTASIVQPSAATEFAPQSPVEGFGHASIIEGLEVNLFKIAAALCGSILAIITFFGTANNRVSDPIFYTWIASVIFWAIALSPDSWHPREWAWSWRTRLSSLTQMRPSLWAVLAVVGIGILAFTMRTDRLYGDPAQGTRIPPEMTSDHVEKILDSQRILEGPRSPSCFALPACNRDIFFANNGGREPFQMYALAFLANLTGRDVDYNLLKTLALFESLITLPIIGWFAWEILATEKRALRLTFALVAMGLVAVSYWHLNITRLALRIVLTPAITSLMLIYLARGMRRNTRADFIKAGICLGAGLYMYQAVRMLPIVVVIGAAVAFYYGTVHWRARGRYALNLAALVLISGVIFIPMLHYTLENPDMFLRRTAGRLFGDETISTTLPDGTVIEHKATFDEQLAAFQKNIPVLLSNVRNALLMFQWKGDVAWINNAPNWPALDPYVGALMIIGLASWFSLALRRGDVVYVFIPIVILVMLLPSALSIAYPIENPSFTRTSGALPAVFLLAAYPVALAFVQINRMFYRWVTVAVVGVVGTGLLVLPYSYSMNLYQTKFVASYLDSSLPYSQAGQILRGFANSDGGYGNAFMIAYLYWWDHRAVGLEAGVTDWPNGIVTREEVPSFLRNAAGRTNEYRLDPNKDLLFFYSPIDTETSTMLQTWFPSGRETRITAYQAGDDFMMYRVPALGVDGLATLVNTYDAP